MFGKIELRKVFGLDLSKSIRYGAESKTILWPNPSITMPFQLPDYSYPHLESYMACAMVESRHRVFDDDPKKLYAKYETKNGTIHVRLLINNFDGLPGTHVHIDTARDTAFSEQPETNASIDDVMRELSKIETNQVSVHGCAQFELASDALPQVGVIALLRQVTTGPADANVRLTGSTFEIEDGPITSLEWKVCEDFGSGELIRAEVHSEAELEWRDDYIIECLRPSIEAFRTFVLEETVESEVDHG